MKRFLALWLTAGLAIWLTGCVTAPPVEVGLKESPYGKQDPGEAFALSAEWPVYDPSVDEVTLFLDNLTGEDAVSSGAFELEVSIDGSWCQLEERESALWPEEALSIPAGETAALRCRLSNFDLAGIKEGTFRIVTELGGQYYTAEFAIGESPITADTPYGFLPLEELSRDYRPEDGDGCLISGPQGVENGEAMDAFLKKVSLGVPCQLRVVHAPTEGGVVLTDVIYEPVNGMNRFLWRCDATRDQGDGLAAGIAENTYSFLVSDGSDISLSNWSSWAESHAERDVSILWGEAARPWITHVEELGGGVDCTYRVWNQEGTASAGLTGENLTFFFQTGEKGAIQLLNDAPEGFERIEEITWANQHTQWLEQEGIQIDENTLLLISNEYDAKHYYAIYDIDAEALQSYVLY
ncbi:hypothetical protein H8790_04565 [Oscillibacter hominis]|uniref:Bacterial Ig-like domain-containing protein n=1 Tax=Oscillibacter hominis TaxID=2763056 RepID=A0A7G9B6W4_9FIRM|nr:immunoglobulin-like domain-containing protein [Oscillibacter hominis]QNL45295.1 hypothetical protein H8790_04565 [Oscillibacter hominis]